MALTLSHSKGNTLTFDDSTPAKDSEGWTSIDAGASAFYQYVNIQLKIVGGSNWDGNATVKSRISADSGTTDDTEGLEMCDIEYEASATKTKTFTFYNFNYLDFGVLNGNSTSEDITISAKWEGVKATIS